MLVKQTPTPVQYLASSQKKTEMGTHRHKFRVLREYQLGRLKEEEAMAELGVDRKTLHLLESLWKGRLGGILPLVDSLLVPKKTKGQQSIIKLRMAEKLGVTIRQVNRLLDSSGIEIPTPISVLEREEIRKNAQNRRRNHEKFALDVVFGHETVENAAERAELSVRQMYRVISKMAHRAGLSYSDLTTAPPSKREKLAKKIEKTAAIHVSG